MVAVHHWHRGVIGGYVISGYLVVRGWYTDRMLCVVLLFVFTLCICWCFRDQLPVLCGLATERSNGVWWLLNPGPQFVRQTTFQLWFYGLLWLLTQWCRSVSVGAGV
jgi:hypothetical protein